MLSDVGPPRFHLRYVLKEYGRAVLAAKEVASDTQLLSRYARSLGGGSFTFGRELIRDWLQTRVVRHEPPRG